SGAYRCRVNSSRGPCKIFTIRSNDRRGSTDINGRDADQSKGPSIRRDRRNRQYLCGCDQCDQETSCADFREIKSSHVPFLSHPKEVVKVIEEASKCPPDSLHSHEPAARRRMNFARSCSRGSYNFRMQAPAGALRAPASRWLACARRA